jgi:cell division septal protein FtsQ
MLFKAPSVEGKIKKRTSSNISSRRSFVVKNKRTGLISKKLVEKILFFAVVLAFIWLVVYVLFFSSFLRISKIEVLGTVDIDPDLIRQDLQVEFSGKYFGLINRDNTIFVDGEKLQEKLSTKYEKIKDVKIKRDFPKGIKVLIEERVPGIVLCSDGGCSVVDMNGFVYMPFDPNANDAQLNSLMRLTDNGNKDVKFKDFFLNREYVQYIVDMQKSLTDELGIAISLDCQTPRLISGDIRVATEQGWWIYFDSNKSIQQEIEMLRAVLSEKINKDGQRDNLEYIDLRVTNKVYYKLKNQEIITAEVIAPTASSVETEKSEKKSEKKKK